MLRIGDSKLGDVGDQVDDVVRRSLNDGTKVGAMGTLGADLLVLLASCEWSLHESTRLFDGVHEVRLVVGANRAFVLVVAELRACLVCGFRFVIYLELGTLFGAVHEDVDCELYEVVEGRRVGSLVVAHPARAAVPAKTSWSDERLRWDALSLELDDGQGDDE